MHKDEIKRIIKQGVLLERLELADEGITFEFIDDDAPLFIEGLGLDSIEALDIVIGIEKEFALKIFTKGMEDDEVKKHFQSVNTLADFVHAKLQNKT